MTKIEIQKVQKLAGGEGNATIKNLLGQDELKSSGRLYAEVTLEPGASVGYHEHHNESETYYILEGEGLYNDNGTEKVVKKGDMTFTDDGMGHGLKNTSDKNLVFMALILTY